MHLDFIDNLNRYFNRQGYGFIETNNEKIHSYLKREQNHIYIVNVLDIYLYPLNHWRFAIQSYEKAIDKYFNDVRAHKKFILNIFIGKSEINELYSKMNEIPIEYEQDTMSINWFVDVENKKLLVPPQHPNKILNIEKQIKHIFNPQIQKKSKEPYKLKIKSNQTMITYSILALNLIIWITMTMAGGTTNTEVLIKFGANHSELILNNKQFWRLFSSMFIHIGIAHLLYNALALYIFGTRVEKYLGIKSFLEIYIISGIMGSLGSILSVVLTQSLRISAGASGAIFGLQGAAFALTKESNHQLEELSAYTILIMIITGLIFGFVYPNVDNSAHIFGLITGYFLTKKSIYTA